MAAVYVSVMLTVKWTKSVTHVLMDTGISTVKTLMGAKVTYICICTHDMYIICTHKSKTCNYNNIIMFTPTQLNWIPVYMHTYMCTHIHTHMYAHIHTQIYMHTYIHICACTYMPTHIYTRAHTHVHTHTHIHTQHTLNTHIHIYAHTHTQHTQHTHTHTYRIVGIFRGQ